MYADRADQIISSHNSSTPLFLMVAFQVSKVSEPGQKKQLIRALCTQAPHNPFNRPPQQYSLPYRSIIYLVYLQSVVFIVPKSQKYEKARGQRIFSHRTRAGGYFAILTLFQNCPKQNLSRNNFVKIFKASLNLELVRACQQLTHEFLNIRKLFICFFLVQKTRRSSKKSYPLMYTGCHKILRAILRNKFFGHRGPK